MRASLCLLSLSTAPGPRRLALLAGAGAVAAAAVGAAGGEEGARVPGAASWLLDGPLPLLGVRNIHSESGLAVTALTVEAQARLLAGCLEVQESPEELVQLPYPSHPG